MGGIVARSRTPPQATEKDDRSGLAPEAGRESLAAQGQRCERVDVPPRPVRPPRRACRGRPQSQGTACEDHQPDRQTHRHGEEGQSGAGAGLHVTAPLQRQRRHVDSSTPGPAPRLRARAAPPPASSLSSAGLGGAEAEGPSGGEDAPLGGSMRPRAGAGARLRACRDALLYPGCPHRARPAMSTSLPVSFSPAFTSVGRVFSPPFSVRLYPQVPAECLTHIRHNFGAQNLGHEEGLKNVHDGELRNKTICINRNLEEDPHQM
ncbi:uncharacterized protein [Symphalangus syndactylus]|uniref:uncharacterized protein n=1 Tax=Symphalangus syndactylus TaxID=9590 RepID=UPI003006F90A